MRKAIALILFVLLLTACVQQQDNEQADQTEQNTKTPVEVTTIQQGDLKVEKDIYAQTLPKTTTPVMSQAAGEVTSLEVAKGDQVDEGDPIAEVRTTNGRTITVKAPSSGQVTMLQAQTGGMVSNTEPMATIVTLDTILLNATVTPDSRALFDETEEVPANFDLMDKTFRADITYVSDVANDTGLFPVELEIENESEQIKPGMVASLKLPEKVVEDALLIPTEALIEEDEETFIYIIKQNKAVKTTVTTVEIQTDVTAITGAVAKGDTIVTKGQLTLQNGSMVRIMKEEN
ncbi:efflux RND transporter periplasmic adaptor subunit [Aquibacillus sp. 3ASR75-11]|uniref:Efflux RND transporter periplasmic adaptor subunit n=1 Tax=Terrihalobacillus insolitus TaxID=2950438 RepID=A0A9X4ANY7_9BACI|nr:efflux RND transporter periplasmic adaptor subunit [Terrihalobacillus insolitus]MDC3425005.1 efflux RND transporter periplasmic adaptor subunit [Terrihalobacillus insolitus]